MQTASRPFYSKAPVDEDDESVQIRPAKPHLLVRLLVFFTACLVGWIAAFGSHEIALWFRNPHTAPEAVNYLGYAVYRTVDFIRKALYH